MGGDPDRHQRRRPVERATDRRRQAYRIESTDAAGLKQAVESLSRPGGAELEGLRRRLREVRPEFSWSRITADLAGYRCSPRGGR